MAVILVLLQAPPVDAEGIDAFRDGEALYAQCGDTNEHFLFGECLGYLAAISDVLADAAIQGWSSCLTPTVTLGQVRDVVMAWLARHPDQRHESARSLVAQALAEAFPCAHAKQPMP